MRTETGGRVIEVGNKVEKLKEAFDQIAQELRSQYNIGYTPSNAALDGTFRKVDIHTTKKEYKIQARSGYYAVPKKRLDLPKTPDIPRPLRSPTMTRFGLRSPLTRRPPPLITPLASGLTEAARTFIKTSCSLGAGFSTSWI